MAPLRVLHVISTPGGVGGAEQVVRQLAADGCDRGWTVTVASPFCATPADLAAAARYYAPALHEGRVTRSVRDVAGAARWLSGVLDRCGADIVHTHLVHSTLLVSALGRRSPLRVTTHHHGGLLIWRGRRTLARLDAWATRRADHVVAVSDAVSRHLTGLCRLPPERVTTIRNGWCGMPRPHRGSKAGATVVCVANFRHEKGHAVLLAAFARAHTLVPQARLVLVGSGPLESDLRQQVRDLGLLGCVDFTGAVDDIWPLLAEAEVFALAAWQEPLGIAVLEAMAAGLPIVATRVGGIPEVVPEAGGRLVAPGDVEALARALVAALDDAGWRERAGAVGRKHARSYTTAAMVDAYARLYGRLAAGTNGVR